MFSGIVGLWNELENDYPRGARAVEIVLLFSSIFMLLAVASRSLGLVWDEAIYFSFSEGLIRWMKKGFSFAPAALAQFWEYNYWNPHPPLMKIISALFAPLALPLMGYPEGYRVGHFVVVSAGLVLAYRVLASAFGRGRSLVALLFLLLQPRLFGEWLIGTTDGPMALTWLLTPLLAWKLSETDPARRAPWRLLLFVVYGCGAATKVTGFLVIFPVAAYFLWRRQYREIAWMGVCLLCGLFFVVLVSPARWRAPWTCVWDYLIQPFLRKQTPIATFYFGKNYLQPPPWHYIDVMSLATFPVVLWMLLPGLAAAWRRHRDLIAAFALAALFWLALGHWPSTPRHDGVRQFIGLFPCLGMLAWLGWQGVLDFWGEKFSGGKKTIGRAAVSLIPLGVLAAVLAQSHPFELSYYNAFIGGLRGAEKRGMEMTYYFETIQPDFLREVNRTLQPGESVLLVPYWPDLLINYQEQGLLRGDILISSQEMGRSAHYVLICRRRSVIQDDLYQNAPAVLEVAHDGVSLTKLVRQTP